MKTEIKYILFKKLTGYKEGTWLARETVVEDENYETVNVYQPVALFNQESEAELFADIFKLNIL